MGGYFSNLELPTTFVFGALLFAAFALRTVFQDDDKIPSVGVGSGLFAAQAASRRSAKLTKAWLSEGYRKYNIFKIRVSHGWQVVISGPQFIDELRKAPDGVLSVQEGIADTVQSDYTLGHGWRRGSELTVSLVKGRLTRSLEDIFPFVMKEMAAAFHDELTSKLDSRGEIHGILTKGTDVFKDWTRIHIMSPLQRVVCRTSNGIFVGLPLCREPEYIDLNVQYTIDVANSARTIRQYPAFLKPIVGRYLTPMQASYAKAERLMIPFLEERKRLAAEFGKEWEDKPNDFVQWIIDSGNSDACETDELIKCILRLNFASIHTTSLSFLYAVYHLAAEPEKYLEPIREEVREALARFGWSKLATENMRRIDSFLRETQRFRGIGAISMVRKVLKDFTFSDGTTVKKGQMLAVASRAMHYDSTIYPRADEFDGFRFVDSEETTGDGVALPNRLVSTSFEFLPFGFGRHACPGRFWAANEMKAMLTYMVLNYDMRMEDDGKVPDEQWFGSDLVPDLSAHMLLKKREDTKF